MKTRVVAFRNIRRNIRRSILSGTAIAVSAFAIVMLFSLIEGMFGDWHENIYNHISGHIRIRNKKYDENEKLNPIHFNIDGYEQIVTKLKSQKDIAEVSPRISFGAVIKKKGVDKNFNGYCVGVDFEVEKSYQDITKLLVEGGKLPQDGKNEVLFSAGLAKEMGVTVGDKVTVMSKTVYQGFNARTLKITGLARFSVAAFNNKYFLIPIETAQRLVKMNNASLEILIKLKDIDKLDKGLATVKKEVASMGKEALLIEKWTETEMLFQFMGLVDIIYGYIAIIFFILGATVIINTTMMVIFERMKEIGTIAAMGMTGSQIVKLFFLEAFFISAIGAFVGVLIGSITTIIIGSIGWDLTEAMQGMSFEVSSIIRPVLSIKSTVVVYIFAVVIASIASFFPSRRAAKIQPVDALRAT